MVVILFNFIVAIELATQTNNATIKNLCHLIFFIIQMFIGLIILQRYNNFLNYKIIVGIFISVLLYRIVVTSLNNFVMSLSIHCASRLPVDKFIPQNNLSLS
jgi:hypothetical protein